ncbi:trehalase [Coprinopsis sp. MPI-PUGE-AT-0042]|nr:trehalase [Coprinopsis sp. MPI-PUGE-AT-0042]
MFDKVVLLGLCLATLNGAAAQSASGSEPPSPSTATPSPSASLDAPLPSQVALPPKQAWCPSDIFCAGELLQTVNLAFVYPDDKTFVDKPTSKSPQEVLNSFRNISDNPTYAEVVEFLEEDFVGEGLELEPVTLQNFNEQPAFLNNVTNPLARAFSEAVHGFWTDLIRETNRETFSLIPLNHTFVVPGGRFREQYYWDSFWILEGLLESELYGIANGTLQNFMDELDTIGFIPNGGRIYYLNRSQPPVFIQMLARYVQVTNDRSILNRGLPLAEKELRWWARERSLDVRSPFTNQTHTVYHYAVNNSAPRPESYRTADLYAELASGAESGWDYTARWFSTEGTSLRDLEVRSKVAVDLNSILCKFHHVLTLTNFSHPYPDRNHVELAQLYGSSNSSAAARHRESAVALRAAVLDLCWDSNKLAFYDFNIRTNARDTIFTAAHFYPFWSGIIPDEVLESREAAFGAFSSVNLVLSRYNGTFPATFVDSHLQWDAPNAWPPHQYIILKALQALPSNVSGGELPQATNDQSTFSLIPDGQLGLGETELPGQPVTFSRNATTSGAAADINRLNGTVFNGGNATEGEGWAATLARGLANRYFTSTLCSWHATGGELGELLPRLPDEQLNITESVGNSGHMFEKFSNLDIDSAGRGGEYVVQAGFGWTNGVLLWVASNYGNVIAGPQCPDLTDVPTAPGGQAGGDGEEGNAHKVAQPLALSIAAGLLSFMIL